LPPPNQAIAFILPNENGSAPEEAETERRFTIQDTLYSARMLIVAYIAVLAACAPQNEPPVADPGENGGNTVYAAAELHPRRRGLFLVSRGW